MKRGKPAAPGRGRSLDLAGTIVGGLLAAAAATQEAPTPAFPAGTEIVTVDTVVVDGQGAPVIGLNAADFSVEEDGVVQEITAFEAVDHRIERERPLESIRGLDSRTTTNVNEAPGRGFVIVFDELHLDEAEAQRTRSAVSSFLETSVAPRDLVAVVGTHAGTRWTARMPEGREALLAALARLHARRFTDRTVDAMTDYEALRIDRDNDPLVTDRVVRRFVANGVIHRPARLRGDPPDRGESLDSERSIVRAHAAQVYQKAAMRNETTLGLIERSIEALVPVRGRKSLILASGGLVNDTHLPGFRRLVSEARRANVAIYFLDARGLEAAPAGFQAEAGAPLDFNDLGPALQAGREASEGSEGLAADTGGFSIRNGNDLEEGLRRIGREAAAYYLLGYRPTNTRADGRFRAIRVEVARENVFVRARRGYYAPSDKSAPPPPARDADFQRALDSPFDQASIPLRATAHLFGEVGAGKTRVLVTTEIDTRALAFAEQGGQAKDAVEYLLVVANRVSGEFHRLDQQLEMSVGVETRARYARDWFPINRELELEPGGYQARIVARDRNSGRVGSLSYEFEVPKAAGLRLSTPLLSDRVREDKGQGRTPEPIARRNFPAKGILHCLFEVYGGANVTAGFGIRRSDGRFLAASPPTPLKPGPDGALTRTLGVSLDGAPAGAYELIVVATDVATGQAVEAREPFTIEPASD